MVQTGTIVTNFNSIKVRLELIISAPVVIKPFHFNSIKVRLELKTDFSINVQVNYFNSIKVRLEHEVVFAEKCREYISIP